MKTAGDKPHELNGDIPPPKKKPRKSKPTKGLLERAGLQKDDEKDEGRLACDIKPEEMEMLLDPWIPFKFVSYLVGHPGTGKSTFIATLLAYLTNQKGFGRTDGGLANAVLLPGAEDPVRLAWAKRLRDARVDLRKVLVLEKRYQLLRDRERLARIIRQHHATLLCIDPIDGYLDDGASDDRSQDVRPMLEGLTRLADETGAAIVFTRNPGKDKDNLIPGSRAWRDVPRIILQCVKDGTVEPRYTFSVWKYQIGVWPRPIRYKLTSDNPDVRQFTFTDELDYSAQHLAETLGGPVGRYKLMQACQLIRWYWEKNEVPLRSELGTQARKEGLGEDTLNEALFILGIKSVPPGERGQPWLLIRVKQEWPKWLEVIPPPEGAGDVPKCPEGR